MSHEEQPARVEVAEVDPRDKLPVEYPGLQGLAWTTPNEMDAIAAVIEPYRSQALEVGTSAGATAAMLHDRTNPASIVCIDTFVDSDDPTRAESDPLRYVRWRVNARPSMHLWYGDLRSFSEIAKPQTFDVIFIDADHTLPGVLDDLMIAEPLLKTNGWLLAHDYNDSNWPDVTSAVDRFCHDRGFVIDRIVGSVAFMRRPE